MSMSKLQNLYLHRKKKKEFLLYIQMYYYHVWPYYIANLKKLGSIP